MILTNMGMRQQYLIGSHIKKHYIEHHKLISSIYNSSEVTFKATDLKRNYESATIQMIGMFHQSCSQVLNSRQQRNAVPPVPIDDLVELQEDLQDKALPGCFNLAAVMSQMKENNYDIQIQDSNCKAYQQISDDMSKSKGHQEMKKPLVDFLVSTFKQYVDPDITENEVVFM